MNTASNWAPLLRMLFEDGPVASKRVWVFYALCLTPVILFMQGMMPEDIIAIMQYISGVALGVVVGESGTRIVHEAKNGVGKLAKPKGEETGGELPEAVKVKQEPEQPKAEKMGSVPGGAALYGAAPAG